MIFLHFFIFFLFFSPPTHCASVSSPKAGSVAMSRGPRQADGGASRGGRPLAAGRWVEAARVVPRGPIGHSWPSDGWRKHPARRRVEAAGQRAEQAGGSASRGGQPLTAGRQVEAAAAWGAAMVTHFNVLGAATVGHARSFRALVQNRHLHRLPRYICQLINEYTTTCIRLLTDEYIGHTFIGCLTLHWFRYRGIYKH
jgi:hypothetical protein